jgi:hypothetical protein
MLAETHVKSPLLLLDFNETCNVLTDFSEFPNIKFDGNLFSGSPVVKCRQTDRQRDMANLTGLL